VPLSRRRGEMEVASGDSHAPSSREGVGWESFQVKIVHSQAERGDGVGIKILYNRNVTLFLKLLLFITLFIILFITFIYNFYF